MIKSLFKIFVYIFYLAIEIMILPFKLLFSLLTPRYSSKTKRYNNNIWRLSKEDKSIAKSERMSDADYIEAEERYDDNLDTDD